jgi:hypothetical protein
MDKTTFFSDVRYERHLCVKGGRYVYSFDEEGLVSLDWHEFFCLVCFFFFFGCLLGCLFVPLFVFDCFLILVFGFVSLFLC